MISYPGFDPVAFSLGPLQVRWYGITYLIAFAVAWWLGRRRAACPGSSWSKLDVDDLLFFGMLGVIFGGRIGYVFFYALDIWLQDPMYVFRVWEGGMSFHGGLIGVLVALGLFAWRRKRHYGDILDFTSALPGVGIGAVRIANFINSELWGRPTDVSWGVMVDGIVRHPTQLYEALLEGFLLSLVLWTYTAKARWRWAPAGLFLATYGWARISIEFWRLPDAHIGYLASNWLTMGHILTAPVLLLGLILLGHSYRLRIPSGNYSN